MAFIKRNLVMLSLVLVGLIGIGGAVWGGLAAGSVKDGLSDPLNASRKLAGMRSQKLHDGRAIEEAKRRTQEEERRLSEKLKSVEQRQANSAFYSEYAPDGTLIKAVPRDQLVKGLLPSDTGVASRYQFRTEYVKAHAAMVERLKGMKRPTEEELAKAEEIRALQTQQPTGDTSPSDPWELSRKSRSALAPGEAMDRAMTILSNPRAEVWLTRAREGRIYLDDNAIGQHALVQSTDPPTLTQIWQAQMGLWIQQDLVTAIARVNDAAAAQLAASGFQGTPWVAYMPIKRLIHLVIYGVLGGSEGAGGSNANAIRIIFPSFTAQDNSDKYFLVPLALHVVLEPEALPRLATALADVGFYNVIQVDYEAEPIDPMQQSYIYGSRPVVNATLHIEGYYLHSIFDKYMPADIKNQLTGSISAMDRATTEGGGAGGGRIGRRPGIRD